jgi:hypothetical protein
MHNPDFLFIQLPIPQLVPQELTGNIPLAGASMALFARHEGVAEDMLPAILPQDLMNRLCDAALVRHIVQQAPHTVGFTCTVWNIERSLYLADWIKQELPGVRIILGGPDIAADSSFVKKAHAEFDYAVEGEGEAALLHLLRGNAPETLGGLLLPGGKRTGGAFSPAFIATLDPVHDPFLAGLVRAEPDGVMSVELYRGCKYACSFCRYHHGRLRDAPAVRGAANVRELFSWARGNGIREIYLLDPSLEQRADFSEFLDMLASVNKPALDIFCELRIECIDEHLAAKLSTAGVRTVETGLQTISEAALARAGRSSDLKRFEAAIQLLHDRDIAIRADAMIGLPGDTPQGFDRTLEFLLQHDLAGHAQIFRTQALPGTRLRAQAAKLGVVYEEAPPYFVLSTPEWPEDIMEESFSWAEEKLGINLAPEERPLLADTSWLDHGSARRAIPDVNATIYAGYDLDNQKACEKIDNDAFDDIANAVTLFVKTSEPHMQRDRMDAAVGRLLSDNPFAALTVAAAIPANVPLDLFDAIIDAMDEQPFSNYAARMYSHSFSPMPGRRTLAVIDADQKRFAHKDWLASLHESCEVVWSLKSSHPDEVLSLVERFHQPEEDYLFVDLRVPVSEERIKPFFDKLAAACIDPQMLLLPATDLMWRWIEWLEGK